MRRFKENKFRVLVATDVAARGLDINDIELVIQLEPPKDTETYIHRSGRTARAGKTGISHTFFHQGDKSNAGALQNVLRQANQEVPQELMKFGSHTKKKEHKDYGAFAKDVDFSKKAIKKTFADSDDDC